MNHLNLKYPSDVDGVWIASDSLGQVAAFITAGAGPIPYAALAAVRVSFEDIEELISNLPIVSAAHVLVDVPRPDDFIMIAERGLFVFDWTDIYRSTSESLNAYEKVATPLSPIHVDSLSIELCEMAKSINLLVNFNFMPAIDITQYIASCVAP